MDIEILKEKNKFRALERRYRYRGVIFLIICSSHWRIFLVEGIGGDEFGETFGNNTHYFKENWSNYSVYRKIEILKEKNTF